MTIFGLAESFKTMKRPDHDASRAEISYDEKTAENYRNSYVTEKRIVSKLSKISIPNFESTN